MNTAPDFEILRVEKVRKLFLKYVKLFSWGELGKV
jgi:hypothetical protein